METEKAPQSEKADNLEKKAIKTAVDVAEIIYGELDRDDPDVNFTEDGVWIVEEEGEMHTHGYDEPETTMYTGDKNGDVLVVHDAVTDRRRMERFPPLLNAEEIAYLVEKGTREGKIKLLIEKGLDPHSVGEEKLKEYIFDDNPPDKIEVDGETIDWDEYVERQLKMYKEKWDQAQKEILEKKRDLDKKTSKQKTNDRKNILQTKKLIGKMPSVGKNTEVRKGAEKTDTKTKKKKDPWWKNLFGKKEK